jgi:hypothetical protein
MEKPRKQALSGDTAAFVAELAAILVALVICTIALTCCTAAHEAAPPSSSSSSPDAFPPRDTHWLWDCPDNPRGRAPRCVEVTSCGTLLEHHLESCCLEALGSGDAWRYPSRRARECRAPGEVSPP